MTRSFTDSRTTGSRKRPVLRPRAEALEGRLLLTAGELDPSFGIGGTTLVSPKVESKKAGYWSDGSTAVQIQPNGAILVAGYNNAGVWGLVRLLGDGSTLGSPGSLDPSFDADGRVTTSFPVVSLSNQPNAIALQPLDGKIVLAGTVSNQTTVRGSTVYNRDFAVVRYNADGSLDALFDGDGKLTTNISTYQSSDAANKSDMATAVTIQADGKILVGGRSMSASGAVVASMVRYNKNGSLDDSFGTGGKLLTNIEGLIQKLETLPDGKILALGGSFLARYDAIGNLDPSFGPDGTGVTHVTTGMWGLNDWEMMPNGAILVAGYVSDGNGQQVDLRLRRFTSDGVFDPTFGGTGTITHNLGVDPPADYNSGEAPYGIHLQTDGKFVVACSRVVARFLSDGSLDSTFGTGGIATLQSLGIGGVLRGSAFQSDGKLVGVGEQNSPDNEKDFLVARFQGDSGASSLMASSQATNQIISSMIGIPSELLMGTIGNDQYLTTLATELVRSRSKRPRSVGVL